MQKTEAPTMAVRYALKQPEEKCPEEPRWKRIDLLLLWEGGASKPPLTPPPISRSDLQRTTLEKRLPSEV